MVVKITQVSNACKRLREQWLVHGKCLTKLMIIIDIIILKIIQISRLYLTRIFNAFGNTMLFFKLSCRGFPGDQWLGIQASTAGGRGSTPGWGTKILHIV